ncbi:glycosyltransferase family 2 protein [Cellvibrio sp. KY-YJ-3]|uniref:glycosyltransferase family 2 protein n=1 Tax=Cellvibrio sp. KY-YJ-3 TaxID=454662 RepID=UPI001244FA01|nr:glycosyltransferase family 2 protein [Cellvibrio sp. KY-YJ-3]QEY11320.1 glycosyltransferase family 2 protein [Cellvibrio sp. KY-YJ-3]
MQNTTIPISVIIVNWNAGTVLKKCVQHLLKQTLTPEVIYVVDNASTDNSLASVIGMDRIEIIALNKNEGFARGNNIALKKITTPYVALLNPDAFPEPQWLESLLAAMTSHPSAASIGSLQLMHGFPGIVDGIGDCYHISGYMWRKKHGELITDNDLLEREIFSPCAAAALYRLDALVEVGGFEESFFCYCEDVDLGFRLRARGYTSWYAPSARVSHIGSMTSGGQDSDFAIYHGHRNLIWVYLRNMPFLLLLLSLPLHLAANFFAILFFLLKGRGKIILKAKFDALSKLGEILKQRKKIQSERRVSSIKLLSSINIKK